MKNNTNLNLNRFMSAQTLQFSLLLILCLIPVITKAQGSAPTNRTTGSPAGAYQLSSFDTVNLFGGNLNFNLPLLNVGGRGEVSQDISLTLQTQWGSSRTEDVGGNIYYQIDPTITQQFNSVGYLTSDGDQTFTDYQDPCSGGDSPIIYRIHHQLHFTYVEADGTEHRLVDRYYRGLPFAGCGQPNVLFGRVFESVAGEYMAFISDQDVMTYQNDMTGYLYFKNGVQSRVEIGKIVWSKDRNGNKIEYTYHPDYNLPNYYPVVTKIKDSIGREVNFEYGVNDSAPYGVCDRIVYRGSGGQERIIRIKKDWHHNALRTTQSYDPTTVKTIGELFPEPPNYPHINVSNESTLFDYGVIKAVWLPDGRSYQFQYSVYGRLARVELPTGGAIEYDFESSADTVTGSYDIILNRVKEKRVYKENNILETKTTFTKGFPSPSDYPQGETFPPMGGVAVVVENFDANDHRLSKTRHLYYGAPSGLRPYELTWKNGKEFKTESYDSDGTTLLRKIERNWKQRVPSWCYNNPYLGGNACGQDPPVTAPLSNPFILETKETLADGNLVKLTSSIDPANGQWAVDSFNNKTDIWEYDYGVGQPGQFLRRTHTSYHIGANYTNYGSSYLPNLPTQIWVSPNSNGWTKASLTIIEYDNYSGGNNASLTPRVNVIGHDTTNYGQSNIYRGNVTKVTTYSDAQNSSGAISVYSNYDILGNVVKTYDAKGNASTIDYVDRFGSPDSEAQSNSAPTQLNGQSTFAFATSRTNALNWVMGYTQFDYFTSQPVNTEDINGVVNTTFYNDIFDRPTQVIQSDNISIFRRQKTIIYDDLNRRIRTSEDLRLFGDNLSVSEKYLDEFGRVIETRQYDTESDYLATLFIYDSLGRVEKATSPHRPLQNESPLWSKNKYDALGRTIEVETPDGTKSVTNYSGNSVIVTDRANRQRRFIYNAINQLIRSDEPNEEGFVGAVNSPYQPSYYQYNTNGQLVEVEQGVQKRFFLYDSLGRLIRVRQPEQEINSTLNTSTNPSNNEWTAKYSYDPNGNLLVATDSKGTSITRVYDALNRIQSQTYSDSTQPVIYKYDEVTVPFSKGKLTEISNGVSTSRISSYDALGRELSYQQITDGNTYTSTYQYGFTGVLEKETYPSGRVVQYDFGNDGKLTRVSGELNGKVKTYANSFSYLPNGMVSKMRLGNGLWETGSVNSRQQITKLGLGLGANDASVWNVNYEYGKIESDGSINQLKNTGNIARQTISFQGLSNQFVQTYKYDSLNRLIEAKEISGSQQNWIQTWGYDRYGNRNSFNQTIGQVQLPVNNLTLPTVNASTNRFNNGQGYLYDKNGNLTQDGQGLAFTFNGDNKQTEVRNSANDIVARYYYDGEGKRIKKVTNSETTIFVYSNNKLIAEYSDQTPQNPQTNYLTLDNLGSPRVITNQNREVVSRRDFMPFGEELYAGIGARTTNLKYSINGQDNIRQRFTGYQKDFETGLDYAQARYYYNQHGRFTAVDPLIASGKSANPQTFNRYSYVMNNPLLNIDANGLNPGELSFEDFVKIVRKNFFEVRTQDGASGIIDNNAVIQVAKILFPTAQEIYRISYNAQRSLIRANSNNGVTSTSEVARSQNNETMTPATTTSVSAAATVGSSADATGTATGTASGSTDGSGTVSKTLSGAVRVGSNISQTLTGTTTTPLTNQTTSAVQITVTDAASPDQQRAAALDGVDRSAPILTQQIVNNVTYNPAGLLTVPNPIAPNTPVNPNYNATNNRVTNTLNDVVTAAEVSANGIPPPPPRVPPPPAPTPRVPVGPQP